ncbi:MAG TPA: hypothetical protein P5270_05365, partial [Victivallales bacterium]|nr:hypothetical protein [Victivallales bacterium]
LKIFQISLIAGLTTVIIITITTFFYFSKKKIPPKTAPIQSSPQVISEQILSPEETDKIMYKLLVTYPTGTLSEIEPPKK